MPAEAVKVLSSLEHDYLPPPSAEIKNGSPYVFMASYLIKEGLYFNALMRS